jgi:hypothetical protein
MGNLFTRPLPVPTSDDTKRILNTILQEMFRRADFIDLYSLADPERCKRYIVVAESALKNLFVKIDLIPQLGADGTFFFQKLEGLQKKNPLGDAQTEYCRILAFYFIRIFQVYAALALSVLDSDLPREDIRKIGAKEEEARQGVVVLKPTALHGFPATGEAASKKESGLFSFFGRGGALTSAAEYRTFYLPPDIASNYTILNLFLNRPSGGSGSKDDMRFQNYETMMIPQTELYTFEGGNPATRTVKPTLSEQPPTVAFSFRPSEMSDSMETLFAPLRLSRDGLKLTVELQQPSLQSEPGRKGQTVRGELYYATESSENPTSKGGKQLPGLLVELFKEAMEALRPTTVSAIPFLQKFKYLKRFEGDVPIEGTRITISNPKALFAAGATEIPIVYKDKVKVEEGEVARPIRLETVLYVKKDPYIVGRPHTYKVVVKLAALQADPAFLKARLPADKEETYATFQTGLNDSTTPQNAQGKTVPEYLQKVFETILSGHGLENSTGGIVFKKGIPQPYNSDTLPPPLKIKALWQALAKDPPMKSYCVARAVQLLNVAALRSGLTTEGYSEACRLKFPYVEEHYVPAPGKPITDVPGIHATELLFFELIEKNLPKIKDTVKYQAFIKSMAASFQGSGAAASSLEGVKDTAASSSCKGRADAAISVTGNLLSALRNQARQLLQRQDSHLPKVMSLLFKMFSQKELMAGRFGFNTQFLAGGMPAVNRLAEEARELLMEYYGDCEQLYKEGVAMLTSKVPATQASGPPV